LPPLFRRHLTNVRKQADCRIVDKDVNAAEAFRSECNQAPHLFEIAYVTSRARNSTLGDCGEFTHALVTIRFVSRTDHHLGPLLQQAAGNRIPNTLRPTRHYGNSILDSVHEALTF